MELKIPPGNFLIREGFVKAHILIVVFNQDLGIGCSIQD